MRTLAWILMILCWFIHTPHQPSRNPLPNSQLNVVTCLDQHRGSPTWSLAAHAKYSMMLTFTVVKLISPTGSAGLKSMWDLHHIITSKLCYKHRWWYIYIYLIISCICIRTWIYQYSLPYFVPLAHGSFHIAIELGPQICSNSLFLSDWFKTLIFPTFAMWPEGIQTKAQIRTRISSAKKSGQTCKQELAGLDNHTHTHKKKQHKCVHVYKERCMSYIQKVCKYKEILYYHHVFII